MGRIYSVPMKAVSATLAQDLWNIIAGANMALAIHSITLGQKNLTAVEMWSLTLRRFPVTVTNGTGGTAPTPAKHNFNDAAATFTARMNDMTTRASTTGTAVDLPCDAMNVLNGFFFLPPPEDRIIIAPNQNLIVGLETPPSAAALLSGSIVVEELF